MFCSNVRGTYDYGYESLNPSSLIEAKRESYIEEGECYQGNNSKGNAGSLFETIVNVTLIVAAVFFLIVVLLQVTATVYIPMQALVLFGLALLTIQSYRANLFSK